MLDCPQCLHEIPDNENICPVCSCLLGDDCEIDEIPEFFDDDIDDWD